MIIWQGKGYLIAVVIFLISLTMQLATNYITHSESYYKEAPWPLTIALVIAGIIVLVIDRYVLNEHSQVLIDKATGNEVELKKSHTLFFIPFKYWPYILFACALGVLYFRSKTPAP
jgi:hypothetical protein